MPKTDGGPAYPIVVKEPDGYGGFDQWTQYGLSKLEAFALAAMHAILMTNWEEMLSRAAHHGTSPEDQVRHFAYKQARAMIEAGEEESK